MKFIIIISFFISIGYNSLAQQQLALGDNASYAIIKDTDGYVNVRDKPDNRASIIGKISRYSIFNCEISNSNWWKIFQSFENEKSYWLEGYINKSRIELLNKWQTVKSKNVYNDSCRFKADSLIITIKKASFNPKKHKLSYKDHEGLTLIDRKRFWGADGNLPRVKLTSLKIKKNGESLIIPDKAFNDLYEPNLNTLSICRDSGNIDYILMVNSDGAGSYTIIWIIKDNKYYGRYIDTSND
jgi:hypothetical protein